MIFWIEIYALIVLTLMFLLIQEEKKQKPVAEFQAEWVFIMIFSIVFILGIFFLIPDLTKERKWFWEKDE